MLCTTLSSVVGKPGEARFGKSCTMLCYVRRRQVLLRSLASEAGFVRRRQLMWHDFEYSAMLCFVQSPCAPTPNWTSFCIE